MTILPLGILCLGMKLMVFIPAMSLLKYAKSLCQYLKIFAQWLCISQDIGIVVMCIITKVHQEPWYVHGFMNYPRVFIPVAWDRQFCSMQVLFIHMSPPPMLHLQMLHFDLCSSEVFFNAMDVIQTCGFVMHFCYNMHNHCANILRYWHSGYAYYNSLECLGLVSSACWQRNKSRYPYIHPIWLTDGIPMVVQWFHQW